MTATKLGFIALCSLIVGLVVYGVVVNHNHQKQLAELRNQLADKDKTIEVQKDVYSKLAVTTDDLRSLLDRKSAEIVALEKHVAKLQEQFLTVTSAMVKWKKAYEALLEGTQTEEPPVEPGGAVRKKVSFDKDFGYIGVEGWTLTDPAEAWVKVKQNRPLKLTMAVTQDKSRRWHTYVTSSEENVGVEIGLTAVNPWLLTPKWYEKIQVNASLGVGDGVLMGLGAGYRIKQFDVGPSVWIAGDGELSKFYGANVSWRPFQRD